MLFNHLAIMWFVFLFCNELSHIQFNSIHLYLAFMLLCQVTGRFRWSIKLKTRKPEAIFDCGEAEIGGGRGGGKERDTFPHPVLQTPVAPWRCSGAAMGQEEGRGSWLPAPFSCFNQRVLLLHALHLSFYAEFYWIKGTLG